MSARNLAFQAASLRHLIAAAPDDAIREGAEGALATILWLEKQAELLRLLDDLRKSRPELFAAMREIAASFPGSRIDEIREKD